LLLADTTVYWNKAEPLTTSVAEKFTVDELGNNVEEFNVMVEVISGIVLWFYNYKYYKL
jgi:hypothetical protein